jgi:hypothetical protein
MADTTSEEKLQRIFAWADTESSGSLGLVQMHRLECVTSGQNFPVEQFTPVFAQVERCAVPYSWTAGVRCTLAQVCELIGVDRRQGLRYDDLRKVYVDMAPILGTDLEKDFRTIASASARFCFECGVGSTAPAAEHTPFFGGGSRSQGERGRTDFAFRRKRGASLAREWATKDGIQRQRQRHQPHPTPRHPTPPHPNAQGEAGGGDRWGGAGCGAVSL